MRGKANWVSDKAYAQRVVARMIRQGKLVPPDTCEKCGVKPEFKKRRPIQAHHYKGYDEEHIIDVEWLCASCHKRCKETQPWLGRG